MAAGNQKPVNSLLIEQQSPALPRALPVAERSDHTVLLTDLFEKASPEDEVHKMESSQPTEGFCARTTPFEGQELHPHATVRGPLHYMGSALVVKVVDKQSNFFYDIPLYQVLPSLDVAKSHHDRAAGVRAGGETGPSERPWETLRDLPSAFGQYPIFADTDLA